MQLALIPPLCRLADIKKTHYQLMLPQNLHYEVYAEAYYPGKRAKEDFVILDNGAAEGVDFDYAALQVIGNVYKVDELVIPDTLRDAEKTLQKARDFFKEVDPNPNMGYMGVVQGTTYEQCLEMAEGFTEHDQVTALGIPRHLIETLGHNDVRLHLTEDLMLRFGTKYQFHFLGGSKHVTDELRRTDVMMGEHVRGMDTSLPYVYANRGFSVPTYLAFDRPENYFELPRSAFLEHTTEANLKMMLSWV